MLDSFLAQPEDAEDRTDPDYSAAVGRHLQAIYRRPVATRFNDVQARLEPLLPQAMGVRQRTRLRYALGKSYLNARRATVAADHFDRALATAELLQDARAFATLALQQAHLHYLFYSMRSAQHFALDAQDAFRLVEDLTPLDSEAAPAPDVLEFGLMLHWELATHAFFLEDYQAALDFLKKGYALARRSLQRQHREASLAWTAALVHRWQRRPLVALGHAHDALTLYDQHAFGSPEERARMGVFFAEVAMDAAQHLSSNQDDIAGTVADHLLEEAARRLQPALADLARLGDTLGFVRAQLVRARLSRLGGDPLDRWNLYQAIEELAVALIDHPLLCQVWTERGDQLSAQGRRTEALACYRLALDAIRPSDASAVGTWARRALLDAHQ